MTRKNKNFANLKLILMPLFGKHGHAKNAMAIGINAYFVKPIRQNGRNDNFLIRRRFNDAFEENA